VTILRTGLHGHSGPGVISTSSMGGGAAVMAADWWDPNKENLCAWAAYRSKGAASLAASYVDLTGNGNNCGPGVAPGWDAVNGWIFDGLTQYLVTTFVAQNDQSQSVLIQFTNRTNDGFEFGENDVGATDFAVQVRAADVRPRNGGTVANAPGMAAGNYGIAGNQGYRTGVPDGGAIPGWAGPTVLACYIGALNNGGVAAFFAATNIQALVIYDCILTAPQMLAVATAMAAL